MTASPASSPALGFSTSFLSLLSTRRDALTLLPLLSGSRHHAVSCYGAAGSQWVELVPVLSMSETN